MALRLFESSAASVPGLLSGVAQRLGTLDERALAPGSIILDVGASVGAFATAAALQFPFARVLAVEPSPQNYRYLLWNIRANNVTHRVWPLNLALRGAGDPERLTFQYFPAWPTVSSRCPSTLDADCESLSYSTRAVTLPRVMRAFGLSRVHWLNLDCDGCEWRLSADAELVPLLRAAGGLVTADLHPSLASATGEGGPAELVHAVCSDDKDRDVLLRGLGRPAELPGGFVTEGPPCSAWVGERPTQPSAAVGLPRPRGEGREGGSRVFLLSSFSHDDLDQWPLIPHFMVHYRDVLGLDPELFLLILHSDSRNASGLLRMQQWLNREYGVVHATPVIDPYSSSLHMRVKHEILHRHVGPWDWVMQVDADELVFFPGARRAREALDLLDAAGENVHYGLMIDRLAASGDIDAAPSNRSALFVQYPLNCALTLLVQSSDVRKASAYRGYLRTTTGNHNVLGLNASLAARMPIKAAVLRELVGLVHKEFGERLVRLMPTAVWGQLTRVVPTPEFATIYHFKWVKGLAGKLRRRAETEVYTNGQYQSLRDLLENGRRLSPGSLQKFCNLRDLPGPSEPVRAFTPWELMMLFMNIKAEHLSVQVRDAGVPENEQTSFVADLLQRNIHYGIARESHLPVH